jgi:hypothetical protein
MYESAEKNVVTRLDIVDLNQRRVVASQTFPVMHLLRTGEFARIRFTDTDEVVVDILRAVVQGPQPRR